MTDKSALQGRGGGHDYDLRPGSPPLSCRRRSAHGSGRRLPCQTMRSTLNLLYVFKCRFWMTCLCIRLHDQSRRRVGGLYRFRLRLRGDLRAVGRPHACAPLKCRWSRILAAEFGPNNVRFNIISPGLIDAHGLRALFATGQGRRGRHHCRNANAPSRRGGGDRGSRRRSSRSDASSFTTGEQSFLGRRGSQSPRRTQPSPARSSPKSKRGASRPR